ncbi:hypothetical protein OAI86_01590 [Alphaproteobacteria bacterium]|nr:hypothetical protein [Alphaproteobacteria bacterium]
MDFYQAQNKYRQKQLKFFLNSIFKLILVCFVFLCGWWFGNNDNLILIQENEKITNEFNDKKNNLERQLTDTRLKLKESNLALDTKNIRDPKTDIGRNAKRILALSLAKGISEKTIINNLRLLSKNKVCNNSKSAELAVSTQSFIPPQNTLLLLSGSLKIKAEGNISDNISGNPYFNPTKPLRVIFIYLGNNDIIQGNLPIKKDILAGKFSVNLEVLKSKVRGAVIVRYKTCKV